MAYFPSPNKSFISPLSLLFFILLPLFFVAAQQPYTRYTCARRNTTSALGYYCNGVNTSCQTYLIYLTQPSYNNATAIAHLLSANATAIAHINNISATSPLVTGKELIVPITCSCAGDFYQSNTSYVIKPYDTPYRFAHDVYQGLTTCAAIQNQRDQASQRIKDIFPGENLTIPIRCACPTQKQAAEGVNYLMTYIVQKGNTISTIAVRFGATPAITLEANNKTVTDSLIDYPSTLLVPLQNPPSRSQTRTREPSSSSPPTNQSDASLPPVSSSDRSDHENRSSKEKWVFFAVGLIVGGALMLIIGAVGLYLLKRRRSVDPVARLEKSEAQKNQVKNSSEAQKLEDLETIPSIAQSLKVFSYQEIQSATENFSHSSWISGSVYMGTINEKKVAIKKTNADVAREIEILNKINHFNLITLLGISYREGEWYLVYEYASNGSLMDWIFRKDVNGHWETGGQKILNWIQRLQIALDVATGLDYLHSYTSPSQVHKDLCCSHVLLDGEFRAKITHFGLSKPITGGGRQEGGQFTFTKHIIGTKGYMAPEYLESGFITTKLDVYAFGILLVEMMTGKEVVDLLSGENVYVADVLGPVINDEKDGYEKFMDPVLNENYPIEVAYMMVQLAERCVRKDPNSRPEMEEIVRFLAKTMTTTMILESSSNSFTI